MSTASHLKATLGPWRAPSEAVGQLEVSLAEVSAQPRGAASSVPGPQTRAGVQDRMTSTVQTAASAGEMTNG